MKRFTFCFKLAVMISFFFHLNIPAQASTGSDWLQWLTGYQGQGTLGANIGKGICVGPDGRIFATGQSMATTTNNSDMPIIALNPDGSIAWVYEYHGGGYDMGYAIVCDADGNVYAAGESDVGGDWRFTIVSVNPAGELRWVYHYTTANPSAAFDIIIAPDGHIYAGGVVNMGMSQNPGNAFMVSLTTDGAERWNKTLQAPGNAYSTFNNIAADAQSTIYAAGIMDKKYMVYSINSDGVEQWLELYSGSATGAFIDNSANDIIVGSDGNLYVTGKFDEVAYSRVFMTMSFTPQGVLRWQQMHAGSFNAGDIANSVTEGPDGSIYVAGKGVETGLMDVWVVIKYSQDGEQQWIHFENPAQGINGLNSIATDHNGNIYATGWTAGGLQNGPRFGAMGLTQDGELLFTHIITPTGHTGTGDQVVVDSNGVAYMVGFTGNWQASYYDLQVAAFYGEQVSVIQPTQKAPMIYPIPANNILNINLTDDIHSIRMISSSGELLFEVNAIDTGVASFDISAYSPGLYFMRIIKLNGQIDSQKVIINR